MLDLIVFALVTVSYAALAYYLFRVFDMFKASVAFALMALLSSILFLAMGQDVIAILQLLVFVGGVSLYLLVGVASNYASKQMHADTRLFVGAAIVLFAAFSAAFYTSFNQPTQNLQHSLLSDVQASFANAYVLDGIILFAPFCVSFLAVAAMKRVAEMIA